MVRLARLVRRGRRRPGAFTHRERDKRRAGLTLLEVMVAMSILSFGMLAMLTMQIHAMRGGKIGNHYSRASRIARDQVEVFHRFPWADPRMAVTGGWVINAATITDTVTRDASVDRQEQVYQVDWRVSASPVSTELRLIDVAVRWWEPNDDPAQPAPRRYAVSAMRFDN